MWFLKCRLHFRAEKVSFIIKGLNSNIQNTLEEARRGSIATNKGFALHITCIFTKKSSLLFYMSSILFLQYLKLRLKLKFIYIICRYQQRYY